MTTIAELDLENLPRPEVIAPNLIRTEVQPGVWVWDGVANGVHVSVCTTDRNADIKVRGTIQGLRFGVRLVDARTDTVLAHRYFTA